MSFKKGQSVILTNPRGEEKSGKFLRIENLGHRRGGAPLIQQGCLKPYGLFQFEHCYCQATLLRQSIFPNQYPPTFHDLSVLYKRQHQPHENQRPQHRAARS
ncbi:hypothetical protein VUT01_09580 [Pseudomonas aeruginosa]|uniref:hypothetical protein n=1 Tax=Pseudomonas aeruginosa TaxID=287 RepID=UPI0030058382